MFWSVPSNSSDFTINTPLAAKSIRYLFFENKNGNLFRYSQRPMAISISIDGRQICRQISPIPFMTCGAGIYTHSWQDVALELNMNVDNSEVKISGTYDNDFNIVFVCSDKEVDGKSGYDFVESKFLLLSQTTTITTALTLETYFPTFAQNRPMLSGMTYADFCESDALYRLYNSALERAFNNALKESGNINTSIEKLPMGRETVIDCDYPPLSVCAFCYTNTDNKLTLFNLNATLDVLCGNNVIMPDSTDISLLSIKDKVPYNPAKWIFTEPTEKHLTVRYNITDNDFASYAKDNDVMLSLLFAYKKL